MYNYMYSVKIYFRRYFVPFFFLPLSFPPVFPSFFYLIFRRDEAAP